jgi:hypothetical protein
VQEIAEASGWDRYSPAIKTILADLRRGAGAPVEPFQTVEALYHRFYPPMEFFRYDLSASEITRFSQFT